MQKDQRRFPLGIVVGLSALVVATGSATAFFTWQNNQKSQQTPIAVKSPQATAPESVPRSPAAPQTPLQAPKTEKVAQVYWLKDNATDLDLNAVPAKVRSADRDETQLAAAFNTLLSTTPSKDLSSGIPQGTKLRSLKVKSDSVYVDLSKEFTSGGGSMSMMARLAQVLYTATSLNPKAKVFLSVEGKPLTVLGGEGLMVDQPLTRSQFEQGTGTKQE